MHKILYLLAILYFSSIMVGYSQINEDKIKEYLSTTRFRIDSEASAVILYEKLDVNVATESEHPKEIITIHRIIKLLKNDALKLADVKIWFPVEDDENDVIEVKGTTYNLVDSKIQKTELPTDEFYKTKLLKNFSDLRFAMPEVRVGSVIDYSFTITTGWYKRLPAWQIQGNVPKLIAEYAITHSKLLTYKCILHSRCSMKAFDDKESMYTSPDDFCHYFKKSTSTFGDCFSIWVRKNVPALKQEPYVTNPQNYMESMDLQIERNLYATTNQPFMDTWEKYNEEEWKKDLAKNVRKSNSFLDDTVKKIIGIETDKLQIAKAIFKYVRDNYSIYEKIKTGKTELEKLIYKSVIEHVFYKREGSIIQINGLLIAMLNNAGLEAYFLKTGTTNTISAVPQYPVYGRLNYTACALRLDTSYIFLDASNKFNIFGFLPDKYYNGYARVISEKGDAVVLTPMLIENNDTRLATISFPDDSTEELKLTVTFGLYASSLIRKRAQKSDKDSIMAFEEITSGVYNDAELVERRFLNTSLADTNLVVNLVYKVRVNPESKKQLLNTSVLKHLHKNPFPEVPRLFPIDFHYRFKEVTNVELELGSKYKLEQMPEPVATFYGTDGMSYQKTVSMDPGTGRITVKTVYTNNKTTYAKDDYAGLRGFYEAAIKYENKPLELNKVN